MSAVPRKPSGSPEALRGVNLGGWLVLERWMSPGFFEAACPEAKDERSLLELGGEHARDLLTEYRDSFITEDDFRWLATKGGVDAVRLPVGFWCFEEHAAGTPFMPTCEYVDKALDWAAAHGLRVLLDFHGASGSQNGRDHSGDARGPVRWLQSGHRRRNLQVLLAWARRWGRHPALLGLGLGNEVEESRGEAGVSCGGGPSAAADFWAQVWRGFSGCAAGEDSSEYWEDVLNFYEEAAWMVRPHMHADAPLVVDTCWDMARWAGGRLNALPGPVWLDYHHYQCFGEHMMDTNEHERAEELLRNLIHETGLPVIIGEFSLALRTDTPGYAEGGWRERYWQQQAGHSSRHAAAFFFWSYKLGRPDFTEWNYRECVERGWIRPALSPLGAEPKAAKFVSPSLRPLPVPYMDPALLSHSEWGSPCSGTGGPAMLPITYARLASGGA